MPCSRAPNTIISGMIAPGNHVDYDSLRGAPLPYVPLPSRIAGREQYILKFVDFGDFGRAFQIDGVDDAVFAADGDG